MNNEMHNGTMFSLNPVLIQTNCKYIVKIRQCIGLLSDLRKFYLTLIIEPVILNYHSSLNFITHNVKKTSLS